MRRSECETNKLGSDSEASEQLTLGRAALIVLGLLTICSSISMDIYLPVLPALTRDLDASASQAQLTITACLLGLALGMLIVGPLSDTYGRRLPLLIGLAGYVLASLLCAGSPTIATLIVARFGQGLAAAVGIVTAQAAGRDLYTGDRLTRYYGRLALLNGLAAVVGPVIGGQLAKITEWRGNFVCLAVFGALLFLVSLFVARETLPPTRRIQSQGLGHRFYDFRTLIRDRLFLGAMLVAGFAQGAIFAYLAGSTFVLQEYFGLSPQQYALAFGLNSLGFIACGLLGATLSVRWTQVGTIALGLSSMTIGSTGLLISAIQNFPLQWVSASIFAIVSGVALTVPATTSLAMAHYRDLAGTAASVFQSARFGIGCITAPLVGVSGALTAIPFGIVTVCCSILSLLAFVILLIAERNREGLVRPETP